MNRTATISDCGRYRYILTRFWDDELPIVCFIGLNPSTADAVDDDPTIRRCVNFAKAWGMGGLRMLNLFAWRSTDPRGLKTAVDPIGPDNDRHLVGATADASAIVAAWGAGGNYLSRDVEVRRMFAGRLSHLGLTQAGQPRHPLYLKSTIRPEAWLR